jgi:hypothetical protein
MIPKTGKLTTRTPKSTASRALIFPCPGDIDSIEPERRSVKSVGAECRPAFRRYNVAPKLHEVHVAKIPKPTC